jgi:hypothetical protein
MKKKEKQVTTSHFFEANVRKTCVHERNFIHLRSLTILLEKKYDNDCDV